MTASIPTVNVAQGATFQTLIDVVNQTANTMNIQAVVPSLTPTLSTSTGNAHIFGTFGSDSLYANNTLRGGNNSVANTLTITSNVSVGNSTANLIITSNTITIGTTVVNTSTVAVGTVTTSNITMGTVKANTTTVNVGSASINATGGAVLTGATVGNVSVSNTSVSVGNSTVNTALGQGTVSATTSVAVGSVVHNTSGFTAGNVVVGTSTIVVGNSTVNASVNSSAFSINGQPVVSGAGAMTANSITLGATVVNTTQVTVGSAALTNTTFTLAGGNVTANSTAVKVGNSTVNAVLTSSNLTIGTVVANASMVTIGGANVVTTSTRSAVAVAGTLIGTESKVNFIAGTNITISAADDAAGGQVSVTINSSAGAGSTSAAGVTFTPNTSASISSTNVQDAVVEVALESARAGTVLPLTGGTLTGGLTISPSGSAGTLTVAGAGNAGVSLGRTDGVASTPVLDFHSGATASTYDARINATGGNGTTGAGNLNFFALNHVFNVRPVFNGATPYDTANFNPANYATLASPAFTGTATFASRPTFNGQTPYDTGNLTIANYAPLASPAFTGTATFAIRPTFNGATPYDTNNLTIGNYSTTSQIASTYAPLASPTFSGTVSVGANVTMNTTTQFMGNTTANCVQTSTAVTVANSTGSATHNASGFTVGSAAHTSTGFSLGSSAMTSSQITCGTVTINTTAVSVNGTTLGSGSGTTTNPVFTGNVTINTATVQQKYIKYQVGGVDRWGLGVSAEAEGGSNQGSHFYMNRYSDTGVVNTTPVFEVMRDTGVWDFGQRPTFAGIVPWDASNLVKATTAQAQAGTNDTTYMTPAKVASAISALGGSGSSSGGYSGTRAVTATGTITTSDAAKIIYITASSNTTLTLPSVASTPSTFYCVIKREDRANATVQVKTSGTDTFKDGATTKYVWQEEFTLYCDGLNWYTIDRQRGWVACYDFNMNVSATGVIYVYMPDTEMSEFEVNFRNIVTSATDTFFINFVKGASLTGNPPGGNYLIYGTSLSGGTISAISNGGTGQPIWTPGSRSTYYNARFHVMNTLGTATQEARCEWFCATGSDMTQGTIYESSVGAAITGIFLDTVGSSTLQSCVGTVKAFRH